MNLREAVVEERILSTCAQVFQIAFRDVIVVFGENFDRIREWIFAGQKFVHDDAEAKIVHGAGKVFTHHGLFRGAVSRGHLSTVFRNAFPQFRLGVAEVAD